MCYIVKYGSEKRETVCLSVACKERRRPRTFLPQANDMGKREASLLVLSTIREINEIRAVIVGEYN